MPSIRKRGQRYQARVILKGFSPETRTFATSYEALAWAAARELDLSNTATGAATKDPSSAQSPGPPSLREALNRYSREVTPAKRGAAQELVRIEHWKAHPYSQLPLDEIKPHHLARYRDERLAAGKAGNTVRLDLALLSQLFETARKEWAGCEDLSNPLRSVRKPKVAPGRDRRVSPEEEAAILANLPRTVSLAAVVAVETAMRRSELLSLRWERIDLTKRLALLPVTKNGRPRKVPLSPRAVEALTQLSPQPHGPVLPITRGNTLTRAFARACKVLKITGMRWHDLRHEAITRLLERGLTVPEVASISGHRTWAMVARYTHMDPQRLAEKLNAPLSTPLS
jgi:integrase